MDRDLKCFKLVMAVDVANVAASSAQAASAAERNNQNLNQLQNVSKVPENVVPILPGVVRLAEAAPVRGCHGAERIFAKSQWLREALAVGIPGWSKFRQQIPGVPAQISSQVAHSTVIQDGDVVVKKEFADECLNQLGNFAGLHTNAPPWQDICWREFLVCLGWNRAAELLANWLVFATVPVEKAPLRWGAGFGDNLDRTFFNFFVTLCQLQFF